MRVPAPYTMRFGAADLFSGRPKCAIIIGRNLPGQRGNTVRKKDLIIIGIFLLVAAILYGGVLLFRGQMKLSGMVEVYADGVLYASAPLDTPQEIHVEQENGEVNIVRIADGAVSMASASCKNQQCLHQGSVTLENWTSRALGRKIVCSPNRVLVELALSGEDAVLTDPNVPDI